MMEEDRERQAQETAGPTSPAEREAPPAREGAASPYDTATKPLAAGEIVTGVVVHIDEQGALVDVGAKTEGRLAVEEIEGQLTEDGRPIGVGDSIRVYVVKTEDEQGSPVLSKKKADYERVWEKVTRAYETGENLSALVTERVKGGLVVDLGLRGFLPASHVRTKNIHALDRFVGQSLRLKILEIDRARKRVVVSQKEALEEERRKKREATLANLQEGEVRRGVVRRITDYGAFVDLGGVDGLLHVTEMSWARLEHPSEAVKVGQRLDVMVLKYARDTGRISLGLKQILPDPWQKVADQIGAGDVVSAEITRLVPFGAFARLTDMGIEGIIPNSELSGDQSRRLPEGINVGARVSVKVLSIKRNERRMTLSLRQVEQDKERRHYESYLDRQEDLGRVTIGDIVGHALTPNPPVETQAGQPEASPAAESAPAPETPAPTAPPDESSTSSSAEPDSACASSESPEESPAERAS